MNKIKSKDATDSIPIAVVAPTLSIEPLLRLTDLPAVLNCGIRTLERLKSAGRLPKPDLLIGTGNRKSPRWKPETIRRWIEDGGLK